MVAPESREARRRAKLCQSKATLVRHDDCGTEQGIFVEEIRDSSEIIEPLWQRVYGRYPLVDIVYPEKHEKAGELIASKDEIMNQLAYTRAWGAKFIIPIPEATLI